MTDNTHKSSTIILSLLVSVIFVSVLAITIILNQKGKNDSATTEATTTPTPRVATITPEIPIIDDCNLEPDPGTCKAYFPRYYFDSFDNTCKEFIWGGCDGTVPFETLEDCKKTCQ